jgi:hypothetical protein
MYTIRSTSKLWGLHILIINILVSYMYTHKGKSTKQKQVSQGMYSSVPFHLYWIRLSR